MYFIKSSKYLGITNLVGSNVLIYAVNLIFNAQNSQIVNLRFYVIFKFIPIFSEKRTIPYKSVQTNINEE